MRRSNAPGIAGAPAVRAAPAAPAAPSALSAVTASGPPARDLRPGRLEALRREIASRGLDALVVSSLPNIRYLTGFTGTSAVVLVTAGVVELISDFRYRVQAAEEVGALARVDTEQGGAWQRLHRKLESHPEVRAVGFEAHVLTAADAARLTGNGARAWQFVPVSEVVETQRQVKSPPEVEAIREAGRLAAEALAATLPLVRAGLNEREIAALLEGALRRAGSEWFPFPTIVASGRRSALPHARTSSRVVAPGDLLLLDFGAVVDGYCSDVTRTYVVGAEPSERQREVHAAVLAAQRAAIAGLRPGLTGRQADALARDVLVAAGLGEAFGHSLGHGIGLEVHEAPRLASTVEEPLTPGVVVTVEPGVYLEGWGGVRIEDDVVLHSGGAELLTEIPSELARLG